MRSFAILTDVTKCIGCEECVTACKSANETGDSDAPWKWQTEPPGLSSTGWTTIERASGMDDETLGYWESRLARGQFLSASADSPTTAHTIGQFALEQPPGHRTPGSADEYLDGPHIFQDNEDSEVFSDLDF